MKTKKKGSLPVILFNWLLVLLLMGAIFIFSSQGNTDSARLSSTAMNIGADVINHWQLAILSGFLLFSVIAVVWIVRRSASLTSFILYLLAYLFICLLGLGVLYFIFRPFYLSSELHNYNYWTIHRFFRKYAHLFIYLFLGLLIKNALSYSGVHGFKSILIAIFISLLYAVSDEVHQYFIPGRTALVFDVFIDTAGASIGIILYTIVDFLSGGRTIWQSYWNL